MAGACAPELSGTLVSGHGVGAQEGPRRLGCDSMLHCRCLVSVQCAAACACEKPGSWPGGFRARASPALQAVVLSYARQAGDDASVVWGSSVTYWRAAGDELETRAPIAPQCWSFTVEKCQYCLAGGADTLHHLIKVCFTEVLYRGLAEHAPLARGKRQSSGERNAVYRLYIGCI